MPTIIVVTETDSEADDRNVFQPDRRAFQLKERVTASDINDAHFAAQLIERIGWALADAEHAEQPGKTDMP